MFVIEKEKNFLTIDIAILAKDSSDFGHSGDPMRP